MHFWYPVGAHDAGLRPLTTIKRYMKARVYVSFKPTVLDPQGQTIQHALNGLGHKIVTGVQQGKFFEVELVPRAAKVFLALLPVAGRPSAP